MKIHEFDTGKGIYRFELNEMKTDFHAHPVFEIMLSKNGGIDLETKNSKFSNVSLAIVAPNQPHKVEYKKSSVLILMVECNTAYLQKLLSKFNIELSDGIYTDNQASDKTAFVDKIINAIYNSNVTTAADERIQKSLDYLNSASSDYKALMQNLKLITHLSDSRLSHLFKKETGTSIKKYFVWSKLKRAFEKVVRGEKNMFEASIEHGFYDQAHLSKAFKQMFGIAPSDVYNSRMLQV
ncbi:MAG: helix-turn-helix transcriptional regulator [Bacteroidota bacterium]